MNSFIHFEDLTANALIEKIERNGSRQVSFEELDKYGERLAQWWLRERRTQIAVLTSNYYTNKMLSEYSDLFEIVDGNGGSASIRLRRGMGTDDLRKTFRSYLSMDMLLGFRQAF